MRLRSRLLCSAARWAAPAVLLLLGNPALAQSVRALPTGGTIVRGEGQIIQSSPTLMNIIQSSKRGVIDWEGFSIGEEGRVEIDNAAGATLNRVLGGQISQIQGMLSATGSVYLVNPHGVVVGPNGQVVTTGSFVASTRQIDADNFMAGGRIAASGRSDGGIVNQGSIVSQEGSVLLIAHTVDNRGSIGAAQGRVSLVAADDVLLASSDERDRNILVVFSQGGTGDVSQTGRVTAAAAAIRSEGGNIYALAGNRDGLVQATGTATINGELWLTAPRGSVEVSGRLAAANADGSGGMVGVNGRQIVLASSAHVTAQGTRGGEIVIGTSGFATGTDLAEHLTIEAGATLLAGGTEGGGHIETSAHAVDIRAARVDAGQGGRWLLDPDDITIDTALASTIVTSLDGGTDVLQQTTSGGTGGLGDITVAAPIVWSGPGDLTLDAFRNIVVDQAISGGGNLTLTAAGNINVNAAVFSATQVFASNLGTATIGAAGSLSSAGPVGIETGTFINQGGAGAVSSTGGDWLIASNDPANDSDGGLVPAYYQYDYNNLSGLPAPGNGRFYRIAPSVTITLGTVTKSYDGTTTALLDDGNTTIAGLINNDNWTLDGTYADKNVGIGIAITADNFQATHGGIPVFGYATNAPVTANTGTITAAVLTASIVGTPTKTYNATTAVSLIPANFALTGVAAGEMITVNAAASAAYDAASAGSRTVDATFSTPNFTAGSGTSLSNYVLPTTGTGSGLINPASLLISGVTANDKVYDGTTAAALNLGSATLFGIVGSDAVSLDTGSASGVFATKNVGTAIAVTGTGFGLTGASAGNYLVTQPTGLAANITPASLVVSGLTANDKIYDGTRFATVNTAGLNITGIVAGDDIVPIAGTGAQVEFARKDVAQDIPVTISGVTLGGADAGNYNLSFASSLAADITPRPLTITANGAPTKIYDGTTNAFVQQSDIGLGNLAPGETISLTQASGLSYASKNVGTWAIAVTLSTSDFQAGPGTLLSNYTLPTVGAIQGDITPAPLTIAIVDNPTKGYDGNANASLGPSNFAVDGFVTGEGATVTQTQGQYASSDAGVWTVTASLDAGDFAPNANTLMSNYLISSPVTGPGTITRIPLGPGVVFVDITGNPTKTYDGNTVATLVPSDYTLGGFIPGEGAIVTETVGQYGAPNAGQQTVVVPLDPTDFLAFPGTNLNNYTLPTEATGVGTILKALLTATIVGNPTRVYNGATRVGLNPSSFQIAGLIAGETIGVTPGNIGDYDSRNAGSRTIFATFPSQASFVAGANTLLSNYTLPLDAAGPGTITPAPLNVLGITAQSKVYDQTTAAQLAGTATLFGAVPGDSVALDPSASTGTFATPNVGNGIAVTATGYAITGADIGNYQLFQPSGLVANITPRGLSIANLVALDKLYDGTTNATLGGSASLVGVLAGDIVVLNGSGSTASFLQSNVGADLRVNAGGYTIAGPQAGNYSLSQPLGLTADINPRPLSGAILGNPTKTYDGTTQVSLTAANYSLAGFVAGEGGAITQSAGAAYGSANAGARTVNATIVVSDIVPNAGTLLSNYVLPTTILGPGTINPAALLASIVNNPTKVYDATTAAFLTSSNFALAGFVAGEGATVTQTSGAYDSKNVGGRTVTASLAPADFTANSGTVLTNYALPASASGAGTITPAQVQVVGIIANDKVYDGTTAATLNSGGGGLSGVFAGDTVNLVSSGASGTFATRNVGIDIPVTALGYTTSGGDAANYTVLQPTGLLADISQAAIQLASVTKVYDANTLVPTNGSAYTLSGVFAGDAVGVDASGIAGNYADKNVGTGKSVSLTGVALSGAGASNYLIAPSVTNAPIGIITPATLNVIGAQALDKTYDQNTIAQLDNTGTALSGVLGSDVVNLAFAATGNFDNANAGTNKPVTTTAYSISGTDAPNYTLVQPQGLTADILQREIFLISVAKVYDGTIALPTAASAYAFASVLSGDTVVAQTSGVSGQYDDGKNVGTAKPVTVNGLALTGASGGNYFVAPSITDTIGTITQATLTASIIGNPTKTYDALNTAVLAPANFQLGGFVLAEGASINQTAGTYDSINAGARAVTASLAPANFDANPGTLLSNYVLPASASGAGLINQAVLTISGVVALDKVYDGTTLAQLNSSAAVLNGIVAAEPLTITLSSGAATGQFAQSGVGTGIPVTASGYALTGDVNNNYILTQPTGLAANITQALLQLVKVSRVYNGLLTLPNTSAAYTLGGVVGSDNVFVDTAAITGAYSAKDVGTGIPLDIAGVALGGTAAGNYSIAGSLTAAPIGEITPAQLSAAIIGNPTRTYDGTTAIALTSANYQLAGFVLSEGATVSQTVGTYDSANAGSRTVTATLASGDFTAGGGTLLSNYILPTSASGAGTIDPKALVAAIAGLPTKVYDGTTAAALTPGNFLLGGFIGSESATVTQTSGTYALADAGARSVTASLAQSDFVAGSGTLLSNYLLPTSALGAGLINQAPLAAAIIGNPTKTYDGTDVATLVAGNFALTGFVAGQGAIVTETAGIYDSANAGSRTVTAALTAGDFTADSGTLLANYILPVGASGAGQIDRKALLAAITGNPTKTYDGTAAATLVPADYTLSGFAGTEGATITETVGLYDAPNAGARNVTALLGGGDFAANSGTLLSNYVLPTEAQGPGTITGRALGLTVGIIGNPTKVYDGALVATLAPPNYDLTGFVSGEGATITQTVGTYVDRNVGTKAILALLAGSDYQANAGTDLANYILPTSATGPGTITAAPLAIFVSGLPAKTYDATNAAILASGNYTMTGFVSGEGASVTETAGLYASANAGIRLINVALDSGDFAANPGTLLSNYTLPLQAIGSGIIFRAPLIATIVGNPTKTYDATTAAALTSGNYVLSGFVGSQSAAVTETQGSYSSPNAGLHTVIASLGSADFVAGAGTLLTNYVLPQTAAGVGTIDPKLVTLLVLSFPDKIYDGTDLATLDTSRFLLQGFVGNQGVTFDSTVGGTYSDKNVGLHPLTVTLSTANLRGNPDTNLSNYELRGTANGIGRITPAPLSAVLVDVAKTYDATTAATLTPPNFVLNGFVAGEGATVTETAGTFVSPNAGTHVVTAALDPGDFVAASGTLLSNYSLPNAAAGLGVIDPAPLGAAIIGNPIKIYDGTVAATLTSSNYQLTGFLSGDGAAVGQTAGIYGSANAGSRTVIALLNTGDFTATGSTLLSNYTLPTLASGPGQIDPRALTAAIVGNPTRPYNGNAAATLAPPNYALTGLVAGDGITVTQTTGSYDSANAGAHTVTAALGAGNFAASASTLLSNYLLPTLATGPGTIARANLTASITGNPTKNFDRTTDAALTADMYTIQGFVAGEGASITETHGLYDLARPGSRTVTARLGAEDFTATGSTLLSNYNLPTLAVGPGLILGPTPSECIPLAESGCLPGGPDVPGQFLRTIGNPRFYVPYPAIDPIYLGRTNAFAGLPSITKPRNVIADEDEVIVETGARTINSTEQILSQGGRGKQWFVRSLLPKTVTFEGQR